MEQLLPNENLKAQHIFFIGLPFAGKSFWGKTISNLLQVDYCDLDESIATSQQKSISQLFAELGEEGFRQIERNQLLHTKAYLVSTGGGTASSLDNISWMKKKGWVIWLKEDEQVVYKRIINNHLDKPLWNNLNHDAIHEKLHKLITFRYFYYKQAHIILPPNQLNTENILSCIKTLQTKPFLGAQS